MTEEERQLIVLVLYLLLLVGGSIGASAVLIFAASLRYLNFTVLRPKEPPPWVPDEPYLARLFKKAP